MDPEVLIERIIDAYEYEEFLQILLTDERILNSVERLFPELCDEESDGED